MFKIKLTILEYKTGTYEGNSYHNVLARYDGKVLKFKLSKDVPNLETLVDKEVDATFSIISGQQLSASLRIDSVIY